MHTTLMLKLAPTPEQNAMLMRTMVQFNAACNAIAKVAFEQGTANKIKLQGILYYDIRERFGLSAQMTVRAISKVCEAFKRDRTQRPTFKPRGAVVYDQRILSFKGLDRASILTLEGRIVVPVVLYGYASNRLRVYDKRGQVDLLYRDGKFYLAVVVDVPEPPPTETSDFLGVDLGIKHIAADSDGKVYSGAVVNGLRHRHRRLRQKLQKKGTTSAKRLLKARKRKESRFAKDVNHCISKAIVSHAEDTRRGIALEELGGIRDRVTVRKAQRATHSSWSFFQLRSFVEYKAKRAGVVVVAVDPRNTSRTCAVCGCIDKANRPSQSLFSCVSCGHSGLADTIAAENIRRVAVNRPDAAAFGLAASSRL